MRNLVFLLLLCAFSLCSAQKSIETRLEFRQKVDFNFTSEWQYLSTDLYLFNENKFNKLVNELIHDKKAHKKSKEKLESLCVTATLKNLKFFGNEPVIYPIYNFQLKTDKDKNYTTHVAKTREVIRIIENLPLATTGNDMVEAELTGEVISNQKRSRVLSLVTSQLSRLSSLANPSTAALLLVGELGKFLTTGLQSAFSGEAAVPSPGPSRTSQYEFSSTIRLYEGDRFDQRLYSIRVYSFVPPGMRPRFDSRGLAKLLADPNPTVDRKKIEAVMRYSYYPCIVAVNYKSMYQMPTLLGEEVNRETIKQRQQQVDKDFAQSLINDETYQQEKQYIAFLDQFADLKKYVEAYSLAYEIRNTDDISKNLFAVLSAYGELQKTAKGRDKSYGRDPLYRKVFRPQYQSILRQAELFLEKDRNLKNSRSLVDNLIRVREMDKERLDFHFREDYLAAHYAVVLPDETFLKSTNMGAELLQQAASIEDLHYRQAFRAERDAVYKSKPDKLGVIRRDQLLERINKSNCRQCKVKVMEAIQAFDAAQVDARADILFEEKEEIIAQTENKLYGMLKNKDCMLNHFSSYEAEKPSHIRHLENRHSLTVHKIDQLSKTLLQARKVNRDVGLLNKYMEELQFLSKEIEADYLNYCTKAPALCECEE